MRELFGWGVECERCDDDGRSYCVAAGGLGWQATRSEVPVGLELPACGADFSTDIPDISFDCGDCGGWDGSLCTAAWLVVLAPLLRRRRAS